MKLTQLEKEICQLVLNNEYNGGNEYDYPVWTSVISDYASVSGKRFSGVISSLTKKGAVTVDGQGNEMTISVNSSAKSVLEN